jgi:signal transduction histidine kinase
VTSTGAELELGGDRLAELMRVLELMAAGDTEKRLTISDKHDELDAIAHAINVLVGELGWATARRLESRNVFFRDMSHEIRTPLAAMLGCVDLLTSPDAVDGDRPDLLKRLQTNGRAVMALLDDVLDLDRIEAHRVALVPEPVCVVDLVNDVLASMQIDGRAKGLQIGVEAADNARGTVTTDRHRLRQILVNLVANAVKFTDQGSVTVSVRVSAGEQQWAIEVADTGIGISVDQQTQLFQPFGQANASIVREYGGNGLGLALSRKLAERLGGTLVLVRSAPGEGSTFRLMVAPLGESPHAALPPVDEAPLRETSGIAGLRILLAEDHRDLHLSIRELLERAGAVVESVHDGREAVITAAATVFDVVLMDLRMPNMDGLTATRVLRHSGGTMPIIALTADPAVLRRVEAMDAGCDACLSKPFKPDDLISAIRLSLRATGN